MDTNNFVDYKRDVDVREDDKYHDMFTYWILCNPSHSTTRQTIHCCVSENLMR